MSTEEFNRRFAGIQRLYGIDAIPVIQDMHVCVVGLGGVGSWAVEALARTGVGKITLIDYDEVCPSNVNRQLHALSDSFGQKKSIILDHRVKLINPECKVTVIDDFITTQNMKDYLERDYDYVIDAIDSIKFKSSMIYFCRRNKIPIIATGGAGGLTDPTMIKVVDLSKTYNDALVAKVRSRLREEFGFSRNPKRRFGVECVFSSQQQFYPKEDGSVGHEKPGIHGVSMDCRFGYGSVSYVTSVFGMVAVSRVINKTLHKKLQKN